jgi:hypothetical protein
LKLENTTQEQHGALDHCVLSGIKARTDGRDSGIGHWPDGDMNQRTWPLDRCLRYLLMPSVTAHMKGKAIPSRRWFWQREAKALAVGWAGIESYKCCALERRSKSKEKSSGRRDNSAQGLVLHTQLSSN